MRYYSEEVLKHWLPSSEWLEAMTKQYPEEVINVRRCRECEYFMREHPTIDTDGDFGYCEYRTNFAVMDDESINWYFTDINSFCNEDEITDDNY